MTDETPDTPDTPEALKLSKRQKAMKAAGTTFEKVDRAATVVESANNVFSTVKWVAAAIVGVTLLGGGYLIYKAVSAPVKAVGEAMGGASDAVKSGAGAVADGASDVYNRLSIQTSNQAELNAASERAFAALETMEASEPEGMKERMSRAKNFAGAENRICNFTVDFGNGPLAVIAAADNEAYATPKALGALTDRLIRVRIDTGDDVLGLKSEWEDSLGVWVLRWNKTTMKKPLSDELASARMLDVLRAAQACK